MFGLCDASGKSLSAALTALMLRYVVRGPVRVTLMQPARWVTLLKWKVQQTNAEAMGAVARLANPATTAATHARRRMITATASAGMRLVDPQARRAKRRMKPLKKTKR